MRYDKIEAGRILLINGPNLNMLGRRDPAQYGQFTLKDVEDLTRKTAARFGCQVVCYQSNHEGELIDRIQEALDNTDGLLINAGAYTHYSYALRDALELCSFPVVEVHISDIKQREPFRQLSVIEAVCDCQIAGHGIDSYRLAAEFICRKLADKNHQAASPNQKKVSDSVKADRAEALIKLRGEIERIDSQILQLFDQRMKTVSLVAADKLVSGKPVFDQVREEQLIEMAVSKTDPEHQPRAANLLKCLMRLSRGVQYEWLLAQGKVFDILNLIQSSDNRLPENPRLVCQGATGSYSAKACQLLFPDQLFSQTRTFEDACRAVWQDEADAAVLPLENTTAGTVDDVYDLLLKYDLYIWQSVTLPIRHVLVASPGTSINEIETVISHPQALAQCSSYIKEHQWHIQESLNTAFAAQLVADKKDQRMAAIASDTAAEAYQLIVLDTLISNTSHNQTRFIAIGKKPMVSKDADRVSLILRLPHQSGALASTLAIFSDRHLNLTKIQSRPDPLLPWTYLFYLDFEAAASNRNAALATLYHLSQEMPYLRFIGWYKENEA